jgi:hypothetical protein
MTNRVTYAPHDFQKMCKQAERDHESKKLITLMERVKRQIAEREDPSHSSSGHLSPGHLSPGLRGEAARLPVKSGGGDASMLRVVQPLGSV